MGGRDARKAEKARAKKEAADKAALATQQAAHAAEDNEAREDFMVRLQAAEGRSGRQTPQQEQFWRSYFKDLFQDADQDMSRELDLDEAEVALASLGVTEEERRFAFEAADADGSGTVDINEFMQVASTLSTLANGDGGGAAQIVPEPASEMRVNSIPGTPVPTGSKKHRDRPRSHEGGRAEGDGARREGHGRSGSSKERSRSHHSSHEGGRGGGGDGGGATADPLGLSDEERRRAKKLFRECDVDDSGGLDFDEFRRVMDSLCPGLDEKNLRAAFKAVDVDRSGTVEYDEFVQAQKKLTQWRQKRKPKHTHARRAEREHGEVRVAR